MRIITIITMLFLLSSCKSAFEQVRNSNDPEKILDAAHAYYDKEDYIKAQALYDLAIPFYRGKKEAEELFYRYSYTYYHENQYSLAAYYFNSFTKTFYNSPRKEEVAYMSAYSNYLLSPNYKLDQKPTLTAIEELQTFINTYPSSPRVEECNTLIDEMRSKLETKSYEQAKLYMRLSNYQSAMKSFENLLKDFPETERVEEVRYLIVKSSYQLAKKSIYEKMQERLEDTLEKCNKFEKKYPDSSFLGEVMDHKKYCNNELKRFVQ